MNENKQLDGVWVTKDSLYARYDLKNKDIKAGINRLKAEIKELKEKLAKAQSGSKNARINNNCFIAISF